MYCPCLLGPAGLDACQSLHRSCTVPCRRRSHLHCACLRLSSFPPLSHHPQENDKGDDKIRQLIDTLDMRKDEAIERTFKGVAKQFRDVFAQVSGGRGRER